MATVNKKRKASQESTPSSGKLAGPENLVPDGQDSDLEILRKKPFAGRVSELKNLLSQSRQAFLIGAGCSKYAGLPLMGELTDEVLKEVADEDTTHTIVDGLRKNFGNSEVGTIEDYMSELVDHISIAKRRGSRSKDAQKHKILIGGNEYSQEQLDGALTEIKGAIAKVIEDKHTDISVHRQFVRAVHQKLSAGKASGFSNISYYILNYDTLFEDALSLDRIPLADGFSGGVTGWWDLRTYEDESKQVRVVKLHGSIDWCFLDDDALPCRVRKGLDVNGIQKPVLIWPTSEKYRESRRDPFASMLEMMHRNLRPGPGTEVVLTVCGYSFSDEHVNGELDCALRESSKQLTIVAFTDENEPEGQLKDWRNDAEVREQVRIHANRGFFHGDVEEASDDDLPWWRFEKLTRLLGGEK